MEPSNKGANYDKINIWERKGILGGSAIGESIWVGGGGECEEEGGISVYTVEA